MFNRKLKISSILLMLFTLMLAQAQASLADVVVITNKASNVGSLTASQVKALFLQKAKSFPSGAVAVLGDQSKNSAARNEFGSKVLGKSPKKLKRYWSKRVFSGKGIPPKVVGNDDAMKAWVAETPNNLGYISAAALDDSVKVVFKP